MPRDSAGTTADMAATTIQPAASAGTRQVVHITLIYDGVTPNAATLLTGLNTVFGAGKVLSDKDSAARGTYVFRVIP